MNTRSASLKVALFSHSSFSGGAETAFVNLVKLVARCGHSPIVFLPVRKGDLIKIFNGLGVPVEYFERGPLYGNTSNGLLDFSNRNLQQTIEILRRNECDLIITNTSTFAEAAVAAAKLGLPHIWSIHEMQQQNPEQHKGGVADGTYAAWFAALSDHQIFCSESTKVAHIAAHISDSEYTVLPPFLEASNELINVHGSKTDHDVVNLFFIGAPTVRKNPLFAIEVAAALRARGRNVFLNFIGGRRDHTGLIDGLLRRRQLKPYVKFLGKVENPYRYFSGKAINFICAKSEPFGLTVPESLSRGFPVVAPNFDGPSENLDAKYQYQRDDVDGCVRLIENVIDGYQHAMSDALKNYEKIKEKFTIEYQEKLVARAISNAFEGYKAKSIPFELTYQALQKATAPTFLNSEFLIANVASALEMQEAEIKSSLLKERQSPGSAIAADFKFFDAVAHYPSDQMCKLNRCGRGRFIEALAMWDDPSEVKSMAFILVRLCTERSKLGRNLRVLIVDDLMGCHAVRLAIAGFDVDLTEINQPLVGKVAAQTFETINSFKPQNLGLLNFVESKDLMSGSYDAVIALDVIQRSENPQNFISFLNEKSNIDGLLFISDGFEKAAKMAPLNLMKNEKLTGLLPILVARAGFQFLGLNHLPLSKPYVFKKSNLPKDVIMTEIIDNALLMGMFIEKQKSLVKWRTGKFDKFIYLFKRLAINVNGHLARKRLAV
jgi:glycosyltransferase involved in cell wall biosynthesis